MRNAAPSVQKIVGLNWLMLSRSRATLLPGGCTFDVLRLLLAPGDQAIAD
jgi:hypothetical protein